ncbi:MAG TPA: TraR/DksA C4-type zinc finger protein [Flavisolibacter sp.]|jgi:RNA polymerase-binding transcription factor DksA|nr:TraR/DksA C4-type zinc finger protein [Flavisolibacter sp.]
MATKKVATKKSGKAAQPAKKAPAKPVKKAAVKAAAPKKAVKTAPAKGKAPAKNAPAKPVKAAAPAKSKPAAKAVAKAPAKAAAKASKVVPAAKKEAAKKPAPAPQKKVTAAPPAKKVAEKAPARDEPVKKPEVVAPTRETTKEATKPLEKSPVKAKEPARPAKVVIPKTTTDKAIKYEPDFTRSILDNSQKQEENGPTMRYSDAELAEFRELINKKLDIAKKELAYLQGLITRKDESGDLDEGRYMTMEDGSMSMEREQLSQMASRQIQFIDHLEKAIMRIENKTYGICRVTGKLIDKARLRAVPHATLSIEAKQMMNK